jgi:thiol-disulfide isomerase/thioredoxin
LNRRDILILLAGLSIGAGFGIFLYFGLGVGRQVSGNQSLSSGRQLIAAPNIGFSAPDFELEDINGKTWQLSDQQGKVTLLNFWATWCAPCRLEMPVIQERAEQYPSQLSVLAINFDESPDKVRNFVDELGLRFAVLLDPGAKVQDLYQVRGYPTSIFVDEMGKVRIQHIGILSEDQLDEYLQELGVGG